MKKTMQEQSDFHLVRWESHLHEWRCVEVNYAQSTIKTSVWTNRQESIKEYKRLCKIHFGESHRGRTSRTQTAMGFGTRTVINISKNPRNND